MGRKFEPARDKLALLNIRLNTVAKGEHITRIERLNRTIKERVRTTYNDLKRHLTNIAGVINREIV